MVREEDINEHLFYMWSPQPRPQRAANIIRLWDPLVLCGVVGCWGFDPPATCTKFERQLAAVLSRTICCQWLGCTGASNAMGPTSEVG